MLSRLSPAPITPSPWPNPDIATSQERLTHWRGWPIRYRVWHPTAIAARQAPPLLLLHGFGSSLDQWRQNAPELAGDRPVYGLDLLGFGGSAKAATDFTTDLWVAQVHDFWQHQLGGRPMMLGGHSLGALVALGLAIAHPQAVQRLILLTLPAAREELLPPWVNRLTQPIERLFASPLLIRPLFYGVRRPGVIRAALKGIYQVSERVDAQLVEQFVAPTRDRGAARTLYHLVRSRTGAAFTPSTRALVGHLSHPTLLLWGEADQVIPLSWGQQLSPLSPHLTLKVIPQAGHCLYDEYPHVVNHHIRTWLHS